LSATTAVIISGRAGRHLVRLRSDDGAESVVLVAYLMASPEFAVIDGAPAPSVEPFGLLAACQ